MEDGPGEHDGDDGCGAQFAVPRADSPPSLSEGQAAAADGGGGEKRLSSVGFSTDESTACPGRSRASRSRHSTAPRISLEGRASCGTPPSLLAVSEGDFQAPIGVGSVSTTDLPPMDEYLERRLQLQRQQQLMIAGVVDAVSREVKTSVEACMSRLECKLVDDVRRAGAQAVAENMEKLAPKLVQAVARSDETSLIAKKIAALTSAVHGAIAACRGGSSGAFDQMTAKPSCDQMTARPSTSFQSRASAAKPKGFQSEGHHSASERSIKTLERELADQILEDFGIRCPRSNSRSNSGSGSSGRRRPSGADGSGPPSLFDLVPGPIAIDLVPPFDSAAIGCTEDAPAASGSKQAGPSESVQTNVLQAATRPGGRHLLAVATEDSEVGIGLAELNVPDNSRNDAMQALRVPCRAQDVAVIGRNEQPGHGEAENMVPVVSMSQQSAASQDSQAEGGEDPPMKITPSQLSSKRGTARLTTAEMRRMRVNQLTEGIPTNSGKANVQFVEDPEGDPDEADWHALGPIALRASGIVPWSGARPTASASYQVVVSLVALAAFAGIVSRYVFESLDASPGLVDDSIGPLGWSHRAPVSELPLALGAVVAMAALGVTGYRGGSLPDDLALLRAYAVKQEFSVHWERLVCFDKWVVLLVWVLAVASQASLLSGGGLAAAGSVPLAHVIAFTVASAVLLGFVFCMLYTCRALALMVDTFCSRVVDCPDLPTTLDEWNVLQAVLRKVSASIEYCFLALQAVMVFTMPLLLADFYLLGASRETLAKLLPSMCVMIAVLRMFGLAALITDKCTRVPALINSLSFGLGTDRDRQHTVDYIISSAAGFYVCDVRLNTGLALKFMYGWSVIAFGLITHLFASS